MDMENSGTEAVILSAVRTPTGRFQGSLSGLPASKTGSGCGQGSLRAGWITRPGRRGRSPDG